MTLRGQAKRWAEDEVRQALAGLFGLVERRILWRRAHAALLAKTAERMVYLLETAPGVILFRTARLAHWRHWQRIHAARAWADDQLIASACGLEQCEGSV
jgi:hypothetical protein